MIKLIVTGSCDWKRPPRKIDMRFDESTKFDSFNFEIIHIKGQHRVYAECQSVFSNKKFFSIRYNAFSSSCSITYSLSQDPTKWLNTFFGVLLLKTDPILYLYIKCRVWCATLYTLYLVRAIVIRLPWKRVKTFEVSSLFVFIFHAFLFIQKWSCN